VRAFALSSALIGTSFWSWRRRAEEIVLVWWYQSQPRVRACCSVLVKTTQIGGYVAGDGGSARPLLAPVAAPSAALRGQHREAASASVLGHSELAQIAGSARGDNPRAGVGLGG